MAALWSSSDAERAYEWVKDCRIDPLEVVDTAESWFFEARDHVQGAFDKRESPVSRDFRINTELLCLWCDAETNIDPTPLQEMKRLLIGRFPARKHAPEEIPAGYEDADEMKGLEGMPQPPAVLERGLNRSFLVISRIIDLSLLKVKDSRSGEEGELTGNWHLTDESPPDGWHGPLGGTQQNLAEWILPGSDAKTTRRRQLLKHLKEHSNKVWGRRDTERKYSVWFLDQKKLAEANSKRLIENP